MEQREMSGEDRKEFFDLVRSFQHAMLITKGGDGEPRGRPMAVADVTADGDVWFVTRADSPKTEEVEHEASALVVAQGDDKYFTLGGRAEVKHDLDRVKQLWSDEWSHWFEKDDPDLVLLCVHGEHGEYWDEQHEDGLRLSTHA